MASFEKLVRDALWLRPELSSCAQSIFTPQADQRSLQKATCGIMERLFVSEELQGIDPAEYLRRKQGGDWSRQASSILPPGRTGGDDPRLSQPDCAAVALDGCLLSAGRSAWTLLLACSHSFEDEEATSL